VGAFHPATSPGLDPSLHSPHLRGAVGAMVRGVVLLGPVVGDQALMARPDQFARDPTLLQIVTGLGSRSPVRNLPSRLCGTATA
jgi:hypothetical protein